MIKKLLSTNWSPLLNDLRQYRFTWLPRDVMAGLSVAAVQVPTAIAYAQLAGFSPEVGLYSSIVPVAVYAFLGTSRQLVVGPDAATCAMVASLVGPMAAGDPARYVALSVALSLAAGLLMVIGGAARMGFIVNFFARPILIGFVNGIAISIIAGQLGKLLGVPLQQQDFIPSLWELFLRLGETHWITVCVGAFTVLLLALLKRFAPRAPGALIALVVAAGAVNFLGSESAGIKLVGHVPAGLPQLALPQLGYSDAQSILVGALGLVIVSFTSGMLTARTFAARCGQTLDANQEMLALGVSNLTSGLSGGFAVTGAVSRTVVNADSGNKTQLASVFAALATGAVAAWLTAPLGLLPLAALAAVLVYSSAQLIDVASYRTLREVDHLEFKLSLLTTAGVLTLGVLPGVALAIMLALVIVLVKIYKPDETILGEVPGLDGYNDIALDPQSKTLPGMIIWRFEGPLVFFNAEYFKTRVREMVRQTEPRASWFILSLESISQTDITGLHALEEIHDELQTQNVQLMVARPKPYMRKLRATALGERLGVENIFPTIGAAVRSIAARQEMNRHGGAGRKTESFRAFYALQELARQGSPVDSGGADR